MAEQRCQEGHRLCANNCGFFGSPATLNLCSKCYRDFRLKEEQASSAKIAVEKSLLPSSSSSSSSAPASSVEPGLFVTVDAEIPAAAPSPVAEDRPQASRCVSCRKKLGLTGFRCRCGAIYCGTHRYPENHGCSFDFKASGRAAIAKANPVVKAPKLDKI